MAAPRGFSIGGINNASADVFEMTHDLIGPADELARVLTKGEALVGDDGVTSLRLESMELEIYDETGFGPAGRNVFLQVDAAIMGARQREHQLRVASPGHTHTRL